MAAGNWGVSKEMSHTGQLGEQACQRDGRQASDFVPRNILKSSPDKSAGQGDRPPSLIEVWRDKQRSAEKRGSVISIWK